MSGSSRLRTCSAPPQLCLGEHSSLGLPRVRRCVSCHQTTSELLALGQGLDEAAVSVPSCQPRRRRQAQAQVQAQAQAQAQALGSGLKRLGLPPKTWRRAPPQKIERKISGVCGSMNPDPQNRVGQETMGLLAKLIRTSQTTVKRGACSTLPLQACPPSPQPAYDVTVDGLLRRMSPTRDSQGGDGHH